MTIKLGRHVKKVPVEPIESIKEGFTPSSFFHFLNRANEQKPREENEELKGQ